MICFGQNYSQKTGLQGDSVSKPTLVNIPEEVGRIEDIHSGDNETLLFNERKEIYVISHSKVKKIDLPGKVINYSPSSPLLVQLENQKWYTINLYNFKIDVLDLPYHLYFFQKFIFIITMITVKGNQPISIS